MAAGTAPLERCGERIARLVSLGCPRCGIIGRHEPDPADGQAATHEAPGREAEEAQAGEARSRDRLVAPARPDAARARSPTRSIASPSSTARRSGSAASTRRRELILTILTQNTADINAEIAFVALRRGLPVGARGRSTTSRASAGAATGCRTGRRRTGPRSRPRRLAELVDVDPAGRARPTRRRPGSRRRCAGSARSAATTRSSSSAT